MIDTIFFILLGVLLVLAALAYAKGGLPLLSQGLGSGSRMLLRYSLLLVVSFLAAGLAETLVPSEWVRGALGEDSGLRGIALATGAGMLTPAGPFVSMPLAAALWRSGAAPGPVVAFVTGWSLLALHRTLAWELPILGARLTLLRFGVCLVFPLLAGLAARALTR